MSEFAEKPLDIHVATATIIPAASEDALQIFEAKEKPTHNDQYDSSHPLLPSHKPAPEPGSSSENPAVFEKENKKMIVLGSIDDHRAVNTKTPPQNTKRSSSPRSASQRKIDSPQQEEKPALKVTGVSENLMRYTAARVLDVQILEERRQKKEEERQRRESPSKRRDSTQSTEGEWMPSERLLRPTQSRLSEQKEWENQKEKKKFQDDIWWELRKPAEMAKHNANTPSKLHEPTAAFAKSVRPKYEAPPEPMPKTPVKDAPPAHLPAKIESDSPLLKSTASANLHSKRPEVMPPEPPKPSPKLALAGQATGPQGVTSKLSKETTSSKLQKYKTRDQAHQELIAKQDQYKKSVTPPNQKKVTGVSSRLMELNESLKVGVRGKYVKTNNDPREAGWGPIHNKTHIPTIEEMHDHMMKTQVGNNNNNNNNNHNNSNSTITSQQNSSGSIMNSASQEHQQEHGLYPEEGGEHQQQHHHHHEEEHHHHHNEAHPEEEEEVHHHISEEITHGVQSLEVN